MRRALDFDEIIEVELSSFREFLNSLANLTFMQLVEYLVVVLSLLVGRVLVVFFHNIDLMPLLLFVVLHLPHDFLESLPICWLFLDHIAISIN